MKNPLDYNFKVRFHLAAGVHFMHWRIERLIDKRVWFVNPEFFSIKMEGCFLRNQKTTAEKIFNGANKSVCAWIECKRVNITLSEAKQPKGLLVHYNPRNTPNWVFNGSNVDYHVFHELITWNNQVFTLKNPDWNIGIPTEEISEGFERHEGMIQDKLF